jgi:hypothetical protein
VGSKRQIAEQSAPRRATEAQPQNSAPATSSPLRDLQATAGNQAVNRLVSTLPSQHSPTVAGNDAADVVDAYVSWWNNLDEAALGYELLQRVRWGAFAFVQQVFDLLDRTDRDDVAKELLEAAKDEDVAGLVASAPGRALADLMFDELTSGKVAPEEQAQADRILRIKTAQMAPGAFDAAALTAKVFPYRLPGFTVFDDAPVLAERRPNGRIWVKLPARVWGTPMFQDETKTLPDQVFTGGLEIPGDEVVGVRFYDLGGTLVYRQALILVQLANETDTTTLTKIAEIAGIGLTLGTGALAGLGVEATMAARVMLWADRAAFVLGTLAISINEHRGEIIAAYGENGRTFLKAVDIVQSATAVYGFARVALMLPQAVARLREAYGKIRGAGPVATLGKEVDEVLAKADEIAGARPAGAAVPEGGGMSAGRATTDGPSPPAGAAAPKGAPPSTGASAEAPAPRVAAGTEGAPAAPQKGQSLGEVFGDNYDFRLTDAMRDPVKHSNIVQLRRMALAKMQASGPDQPVKVVPLHYDSATTVKGDITLAKFVTGRTPEQLAQELGVTAFAKGVRVYRLDRSALNESNLNLRGYSQSPAGKAPQLSTPENLAKWPVGKGSVQYNTTADIPVTSAADVRPGQVAVF